MGAIGARDRLDFTVLGGVVNLASRLCDAAPPDGILVAGAVRDALAGAGLRALRAAAADRAQGLCRPGRRLRGARRQHEPRGRLTRAGRTIPPCSRAISPVSDVARARPDGGRPERLDRRDHLPGPAGDLRRPRRRADADRRDVMAALGASCSAGAARSARRRATSPSSSRSSPGPSPPRVRPTSAPSPPSPPRRGHALAMGAAAWLLGRLRRGCSPATSRCRWSRASSPRPATFWSWAGSASPSAAR